MLPGSSPLWVPLRKEGGEINLFPVKTGIGGKNPLDRVTGCNGRGDVIDGHTRSANYRGPAENAVVHGHLIASSVQTFEALVHISPERCEVDGQKSIMDDLRGLLSSRMQARHCDHPLPLLGSQPAGCFKVESDKHTGIASE